MKDRESEKEQGFDWVTEGERFSTQPMCTNLTGECARRELKVLKLNPDKLVAVINPDYIDVSSLVTYSKESKNLNRPKKE